MQKVTPHYLRLLDSRLVYTGRHRELASWRLEFQEDWNKCAKTVISDPDNKHYRPRPYSWVCACPAFVTSRFLICKHLVQSVHPVTPAFFRQVSRERDFPLWRHHDLRPIHPPADDDIQEIPSSLVTMPSAGIDNGDELRRRGVEDLDDSEGGSPGSRARGQTEVDGEGSDDDLEQ